MATPTASSVVLQEVSVWNSIGEQACTLRPERSR